MSSTVLLHTEIRIAACIALQSIHVHVTHASKAACGRHHSLNGLIPSNTNKSSNHAVEKTTGKKERQLSISFLSPNLGGVTAAGHWSFRPDHTHPSFDHWPVSISDKNVYTKYAAEHSVTSGPVPSGLEPEVAEQQQQWLTGSNSRGAVRKTQKSLVRGGQRSS